MNAMNATNMTYYEERAWACMAKSGELHRYLALSSSGNSGLYHSRLRELAIRIEQEEQGAR